MLFPWSSRRVQDVAHRADPASVRTSEDAVAWSAELVGQDGDAKLVSVQDLASLVKRGGGSNWAEAAETAKQVAAAHRDAADLLRTVLDQLGTAWRGDAADAAADTTRKFNRIIDTAEATFGHNCRNVGDADLDFQRLKAALAQLGTRPEKNFYDDLTPWNTDTENAITAYNEKAARALEHYHAYAAQLDHRARDLKHDYGGYTDEPDGRAAPVSPAGTGSRSATAAEQALTAPGTASPPVGGAELPAGAEPPAGTERPAGAESGPGVVTPPLAGTAAGSGSNTTVAGYAPAGAPVPPVGTSAVSGSPAPAPSPGSATAMPPPGFAGNFRGKLPGGPPGGQSGGTSVPREDARAAQRPSGNRSAGGTGGHVPGRPARGQRDQDHERKYVLDDGSLFTDDERHALVDPATGRPVVDPTIGA